MNNAYAALFQDAGIGSLGPDHVRRYHSFTKKTDAIKVGNGTRSMGLHTILDFAFRFGDVRNDWRARAIGECTRRLQVFFRNCVGGMRSNRRDYQLVSLPSLNKLLDVSHGVGIRLVIGNWKVDDSFA